MWRVSPQCASLRDWSGVSAGTRHDRQNNHCESVGAPDGNPTQVGTALETIKSIRSVARQPI
eukprot:14034634-Alexandrium_andersonii.AAC.1